jgi:pSer/pThr/pTyr-binding forkhead associated (FHA) protein
MPPNGIRKARKQSTRFYQAGSQVTAKKSNYNGSVAVASRRTGAKIATLTIQNGCFAGLEISLKKKKTILGRDLACDICLDDSLVSNEHAMVVREGEKYSLEDLNSRNGTYVNGTAVQKRTLKHGEMISIGDFSLKFKMK